MLAPEKVWWAVLLRPSSPGGDSSRYFYTVSFLLSDILTLLQIDDDENVAETVLVEIHADNDESFVDKNVTFTMYKIGESPGGE